MKASFHHDVDITMTAAEIHQPENQGGAEPIERPIDLKPNEQARDSPEFSEDGVVIVVMGGTGAGKSTFISLLADQEVQIGHDLKSCTTKVSAYSFSYNDQQTVYVVDTPGFDDTDRPDSEILQEIAFFLAALYPKKARLAGLIYLHRITDTRVSGSSLKNMHVFQKLCGETAFPCVILATTMWAALEAIEDGGEIGRQRCDQLQRPEFWGEMLQRGSIMMKHDGSEGSARAIVSKLVEKEAGAVLDIQVQMVDENRSLDETDAGRYLQKNFLEARERYEKDLAEFQESMEQALAQKDAETVDFIKKEREAAESRMIKLQNDNAQLKVSLGQLATRVRVRYRPIVSNFEASPAAISDPALEPRLEAMEKKILQLKNELQECQNTHRHDIQYQRMISKHQVADNVQQERVKAYERALALADQLRDVTERYTRELKKKNNRRGWVNNRGIWIKKNYQTSHRNCYRWRRRG